MTRPALLLRCTYLYDDRTHAETWRNDLARDMNQILNRAHRELTARASTDNINFANAALNVVRRMAEDEEIKFE
jgi:hypothetical protein